VFWVDTDFEIFRFQFVVFEFVLKVLFVWRLPLQIK